MQRITEAQVPGGWGVDIFAGHCLPTTDMHPHPLPSTLARTCTLTHTDSLTNTRGPRSGGKMSPRWVPAWVAGDMNPVPGRGVEWGRGSQERKSEQEGVSEEDGRLQRRAAVPRAGFLLASSFWVCFCLIHTTPVRGWACDRRDRFPRSWRLGMLEPNPPSDGWSAPHPSRPPTTRWNIMSLQLWTRPTQSVFLAAYIST